MFGNTSLLFVAFVYVNGFFVFFSYTYLRAPLYRQRLGQGYTRLSLTRIRQWVPLHLAPLALDKKRKQLQTRCRAFMSRHPVWRRNGDPRAEFARIDRAPPPSPCRLQPMRFFTKATFRIRCAYPPPSYCLPATVNTSHAMIA